MTRIGIASDHGGYDLKEKLKGLLESKKFELVDFGASSFDENDDYPDKIMPLALAISEGTIEKGIAVCGSGVGASIVANKLPGVRAALITETYSAHQGVEHDDMNILCIGGRVTGTSLALEIVNAFLEAQYREEERFDRRLKKLMEIEDKYLRK
jgi:ribose 5-phosphate isomerase B